jgi:hypothetical protein
LQTSAALGAAACQIGPDAQAAVALLNKTAGLSHGKMAMVFPSLFGIERTRGASVQIRPRTANRLEPADEEIGQEIKTSRRLTPDETGWPVAGKPAWRQAWVVERAVCYAVEQYRKADALANQIGLGWTGQMTPDGFSSYDRFPKATHQQCLRHIIKRVRELAAKATRGAVHYPRKLLALFTEAIHLRNRHLKGEVPAAERKQARKRLGATRVAARRKPIVSLDCPTGCIVGLGDLGRGGSSAAPIIASFGATEKAPGAYPVRCLRPVGPDWSQPHEPSSS